MKTIFILSKDSGKQHQVENHLSSLGYAVQLVDLVETAGMKSKPYAVILDIDGLTAAHAQDSVSKVKKAYRTSVIVVTSSTDAELHRQLVNEGAVEVIEKNSALYVHLRTTLDTKITSNSGSWISRLFGRSAGDAFAPVNV